MQRILIVDDDLHLRKLVTTYAQLEGFRCEEAQSGREAVERIENTSYDLIVLDVMMPGIDGFETLAEIRKTSEVPVIMLTARGEEYDRLLGFNLGADDYVPKPFSPKELMARVGAVLKRIHKSPDDTLSFGALRISPLSRSVTLDGAPLAMPPKEFDILVFLAQNERMVFTRGRLVEKIWGYDYAGDTRTVDTHVKSLREHLKHYRKIIQTVWGVGYKFEYSQESE